MSAYSRYFAKGEWDDHDLAGLAHGLAAELNMVISAFRSADKSSNGTMRWDTVASIRRIIDQIDDESDDA